MSCKISLAGDLGSGKSTVAKILLENNKNMEYYSTGALMRDIAASHGLTIEGLNIYMETHPEIDHEIDDGLKKLSSDERELIIDSRMAWHFVEDTFKIYLSCDAQVCAARILSANRSEENFENFDEALRSITGRRASEKKRYFEQYGVDIKDMSNYNFVLDTTSLAPELVAFYIEDAYSQWKENHSYRACLVSPTRLLYPSEEVDMETAARLSDSLDDGIDIDEIRVFEDDGAFYIAGGTNSALAYALCDNPLVPVRLVKEKISKDIEFVKMANSL